jgi:hypothetical protein
MDPDPDFLMRIRKLIQNSGFLFDADPVTDVDTGYQNCADPDFNGENVMSVQRI